MTLDRNFFSIFSLLCMVATKAMAQSPGFEVNDLPKEPPIEGQLGEPGAPSLPEQQEHLARSLLEKGICNVSYFGEDFCKKHQQKSFRVTEQFGGEKPSAVKSSQE
jgi:hypothetical protein